jgi:hypothetical protein
MSLEQKIKSRLDDYLGFNSDKLFTSCNPSGLIRIFGGAIRDSISEDPINDIDILVGSISCKRLENFLNSIGWTYREDLLPKDLASVYNDIHVINEPHTWMYGNKTIQIIRPVIKTGNLHPVNRKDIYEQGFKQLISNVDISCCGVSWDGTNLHEDYSGSVVHCQNKVFSVNKKAQMYSQKRIIHRIDKMEKRGWEKIESDIVINRDMKIENILYI